MEEVIVRVHQRHIHQQPVDQDHTVQHRLQMVMDRHQFKCRAYQRHRQHRRQMFSIQHQVRHFVIHSCVLRIIKISPFFFLVQSFFFVYFSQFIIAEKIKTLKKNK